MDQQGLAGMDMQVPSKADVRAVQHKVPWQRIAVGPQLLTAYLVYPVASVRQSQILPGPYL